MTGSGDPLVHNYLKAVIRLYIMEAVIRWCPANYLCMGRLVTQSIFRAFIFILVHQRCMAERGRGFDVVIRIAAPNKITQD